MQGTIKKTLTKTYSSTAIKLDGIKFEDLNKGDSVTFDTEDTDKGPAATNVKKLKTSTKDI